MTTTFDGNRCGLPHGLAFLKNFAGVHPWVERRTGELEAVLKPRPRGEQGCRAARWDLLVESLTDDARRHDGIDLLLEPPTPVDASLVTNLSTCLVARHCRWIGARRIDIVVAVDREADDRPVVRQARQSAIELTRTTEKTCATRA